MVSGDSSNDRYGALAESDAVFAADRPLQRDDAFEQHPLGLVRPLDPLRRRPATP